jgi:hypothetical protein
MRRTSQIAWIAWLASILACALGASTASASVGPTTGEISTFAGSPVFGPVSALTIGTGGGGSGDVATATIDGTPYLYYAGSYQQVVRRIDLTTDEEQVVAGNGGFGAPVEGSPATATTIGPADSIAVDANGDMAILAERGVVLFVPANSGTYFGVSMSAGDIYPVPSVDAEAIALSPQGNLAYSYDGVIGFVSIGSAKKTALAVSGSTNNQAVAIDASGDIVFLGPDGDEVEFAPASSSGTYSGPSKEGSYFGISMPTAGTGYALVDHCDNDNCNGGGLGDGGYAPNASTGSPGSLAFDSQGDLAIGDGGNYRTRFVPASSGNYYGQPMSKGDIYGIAGNGENGANAKPANGSLASGQELPLPEGVSIDSSGDAVIGSALAGLLLVSHTSGDLETISGDGSYGYDGDGIEGATSQFGGVSWVASDLGGNVAIVDGADSRVRFIPTASGNYFGEQMTGGDIYTIAGDGIPRSLGACVSGTPATSAKFDFFQYGGGIALDANGDLAIADPDAGRICFVPAQSGSYYGQSMTAGDVYAVGGSLTGSDVTFDSANDLLVADGSVQELATGTSTPTTLPGSAGVDANDLAVDTNGDVAVTSFGESTVTLIPAHSGEYFGKPGLSAGTPTVVAGSGTQGFTGDKGVATEAELDTPSGLAFDASGDLAIAQEGSGSPFHTDDAVRFLPQKTGEFYGQSMTTGDIYTIAGNGKTGFLGDGGPGPAAELAQPSSVAMMPGEDVLIADPGNNRVRVLYGSAPTATTGAAGTPTDESDTVAGSVNPQGRAIGYHFEYGTTTAYGASEPASDQSAGNDHADHPESQTLTALSPGTTYHYRIVADFDEAGATVSAPGEDATFTTAPAPATEKEPEPKGVTTGTTTTITTSPGTEPTKSPVLGPTSPPTISPILQCTTAQVALINVVQQGSHVEITGAARLVLAGKRVSIKFLATHKVVATATIAANGTFSATAPLPPSKIRETNLARYEAVVGSLHSLNLKLDRRMYMTSATRSGAHVLLSGYVTGSFTPGAVVKILLRVSCSSEKVIAKVKLGSTGKFSATVPAPTGTASQIAVYRGATTVLKDGHPEGTFTLPTPPTT